MSNLNRFLLSIFIFLLLFIADIHSSFAANGRLKKNESETIQTTAVYSPMDINNVFNYYSNNGDGSFNPFSSENEGFECPIGSNKGTCIFEDGLVWTAFKSGVLLCGGSTYNHGLQPGRIVSNGTSSSLPVPDDPTKPEYRVYRVRPDMKPTTDLSTIAAETNLIQSTEEKYISRYQSLSASDIVQQYWNDWNQWPADEGAPFTDANGVVHPDGGSGYDPTTCTPGYPEADQTEWMVMNDVNATLTQNLYGSNPIGLEVQRTIWAYKSYETLGNTIFISYKLINKSGVELDSMYVSQWADPDIGYAGDDAAGCDTLLNLGYAYNGTSKDANFALLDSPPPAAGFNFLEGPIVPGAPTDTALFDMREIPGYRNLPMTAFEFAFNGSLDFAPPGVIFYELSGSQQWYNIMKGLVGTTGAPFPNTVTGGSKYCYPGDPVAGTGPTYIGLAAVASPGDIRICLNSGPFIMAPGDTQQVVIDAIAGAGEDYLQSIYTVKKYAFSAALVFNNVAKGSGIPIPEAPITSITNDSNSVQLHWENNAEGFNQSGYLFEGYNVYQMSSPIASKDASTLVATYDKVDGVKSLYGETLDPSTDQVITQQQQFGTDSGLKYNFTATKDYINNAPFIKGEKYFFTVTSYSYNPSPQVNLNNAESDFIADTVWYNINLTGPNYGDQGLATHTTGVADATVTIAVGDPSKLTGHQYQVSFHDEVYSLGSSGVWMDVTQPLNKRKGLPKTTDLTGSSISSVANWDETKGVIDIHNMVDVESPNYDFCDAIKLTFPAGIIIDTAYNPISNNDGSSIPYYINKATGTVIYGDSAVQSSDSTLRTGDGIFVGGEDIVVKVHPGTVPMVIHYTMYDDNFGATYDDSADGFPFGRLVDVTSSDTITSIATLTVTEHQWNVNDLTAGKIALQNQTIYDGNDIYAPDYYFENNGIYGPGGSSGSLFASVGSTAGQLFDGIRVYVVGNFRDPTTIGAVQLNGSAVPNIGGASVEFVGGGYDISDFTIFGSSNGTVRGSLSSYAPEATGGVPPSDINDLEQDYELKWTGVTGDTIINGDTVVIIKSGGSLATLFAAHNYSIANHPLNPNPGSASPFTIRIPFEVWNTDKNEQVNLLVYDRFGNWPAQDFQVWNTLSRMYVWVVNARYITAVLDPSSAIVADSATWNWVFFTSEFHTGDDMKIVYNNPLEVGKDTFMFTDPGSGESTLPSNVIKGFSLSQNYPNPFNPSTTILYELPAKSNVTVKIYNILGQEVRTLVNQIQQAGQQAAIWDSRNNFGREVSSGVYFYRIEATPVSGTGNVFSSVKKMLLLK
jgi:FlgD Ig-like domain